MTLRSPKSLHVADVIRSDGVTTQNVIANRENGFPSQASLAAKQAVERLSCASIEACQRWHGQSEFDFDSRELIEVVIEDHAVATGRLTNALHREWHCPQLLRSNRKRTRNAIRSRWSAWSMSTCVNCTRGSGCGWWFCGWRPSEDTSVRSCTFIAWPDSASAGTRRTHYSGHRPSMASST